MIDPAVVTLSGPDASCSYGTRRYGSSAHNALSAGASSADSRMGMNPPTLLTLSAACCSADTRNLISAHAAAFLTAGAAFGIHNEPSPTGTPPPGRRPGSGHAPTSVPGYSPLFKTASIGPKAPDASNVIAASRVPSASRCVTSPSVAPVFMASPDSTMSRHHVQIFRPPATSSSDLVARALRPLA